MSIQTLPGLESFLLPSEWMAGLKSEFQLVLKDANFNARSKIDILEAIHGKYTVGVYFLVMSVEISEYRIYIGKTKSLERRVADYLKEFQAHSPNDYKIRIFQQTLLKLEPRTQFSLYFKQSSLSEYTKLENNLIKKYDPLLNRRADLSQDARDSFRKAFEAFYRAGFETTLNKCQQRTVQLAE